MTSKQIIIAIVSIILTPFFIYFCVKLATIAIYKGKEFIDKQKEEEQKIFDSNEDNDY